MTDTNPTEQNRADLWQKFQRLDTLPASIVQILAVSYQSATRQLLCNYLNTLDPRPPRKKRTLTPSDLEREFKQLLSEKLILEKNARISCNPLISELCMRELAERGELQKFVELLKRHYPHFSMTHNMEHALPRARLTFYQGNFVELKEILQSYAFRQHLHWAEEDFYLLVCNHPFDAEWFARLPLDIQNLALPEILREAQFSLEPAPRAFEYLRRVCGQQPENWEESTRALLLELLLLHGEFEAFEQMLEGLPASGEIRAARAWWTFLRGDTDKAIELYQQAFALLKKGNRKRKIYFRGMAGIFYILALFGFRDPEYTRQAYQYLDYASSTGNPYVYIYHFINKLSAVLANDTQAENEMKRQAIRAPGPASAMEPWSQLSSFFLAFCKYWITPDSFNQESIKALEVYQEKTRKAGYAWLATELSELLGRIHPSAAKKRTFQKLADEFHEKYRLRGLSNVIKLETAWERALNALINLNEAPTQATAKASRLVWWLDYQQGDVEIQPREQKLSANGKWSKGRVVGLKRLHEEAGQMDYLTAQDVKICAHIRQEREGGYGYYYNLSYVFDPRVVLSMVGHPLLFRADSPSVRVELVRDEPRVLVSKLENDRLLIKLEPDPPEDAEIVVLRETPTRYKVVEFTSQHQQIEHILGTEGLEVPSMAKDQVLRAISTISSLVTIHSDIGGGVKDAEEVSADPRPRMHLLPHGEGLKASLLVRPFADGGPYYPPGVGGENLVAEVKDKRLQTRRDLKQEKALAEKVIEHCTTLEHIAREEEEWLLEEPEDCLQLLTELNDLREEVVLEWPEGEKFKLAGQAGLNQFRVQVKQDRDWFGMTGELQLDEGRVLDMQRLLGLLDHAKGRFVQMEDGQFVALTQEFRKRLEELRAYGELQGKKLRLHPLAALALEDLPDEVEQFKSDKHWKELLKRIEHSRHYQPELPSTFQAELRDYQLEGFQWLARLSQWGVGACLADDMGLGKTIQALATMLLRAPEGPSLVVAPTSVCMNWQVEAERFAPTLNPIYFGAGNRQKTLESLKPYDLLICSYGLLQQEQVADMLGETAFQTIILDEAQAIKNFATKRSQAAMGLQGEFKVLTTGTPIENHLGELWNLFRFINPGLLGSLEHFNRRFALPIERNQDKQARQQLKKLIQPFILRRTKSQVLEELPPRTEIVIHVELSREERNFYEALRRDALEKLVETDAPPGQKHLQILAEITRLRRSCCNTQLVRPDVSFPSSKLEAFGEIVEELLENRHKALVFSQFVDHLHLIQTYLESRNIRYQYLDGSTPSRERKQRVDAFQSGEGEVFLISLKAGGVGLNLTAADYVIHMDPWWNPAVEDQASDRAHRIGQQRPVTIYRLVAKETIEEKIVDLHHHKRDLADSLLEGADMSGKVSSEELLALMREE